MNELVGENQDLRDASVPSAAYTLDPLATIFLPGLIDGDVPQDFCDDRVFPLVDKFIPNGDAQWLHEWVDCDTRK